MYKFKPKQVVFWGSSLDDLRAFPEPARREAGYQIDRVQRGLHPSDSKSVVAIGDAVFEIRIFDAAGTFRVIYVAKFEECIFVLHCFQKKTQKLSKKDIEIAKRRYKELIRELLL